MNHFVRTIIILANVSLALSGQSADYSSPSAGGLQAASHASAKPDNQAPKESDEVRAVAALMTLGVPLGRDSSGRVRWIEAANGELSDEAMRYLTSLPLLEWLEIGGGKVTANGIAHLKQCPALRRLYIHDVNLGEDRMNWLADLRLEACSLQRTGISGQALWQLKATGALTVLNISENNITDEDLSQVARFTSLEVLALQNTKVTGAGLARLKRMSRLNVLNLKNCRIEDADLSHFTSMPNLRIVHASGCNISDQAVKGITAKLPLLAVFR